MPWWTSPAAKARGCGHLRHPSGHPADCRIMAAPIKCLGLAACDRVVSRTQVEEGALTHPPHTDCLNARFSPTHCLPGSALIHTQNTSQPIPGLTQPLTLKDDSREKQQKNSKNILQYKRWVCSTKETKKNNKTHAFYFLEIQNETLNKFKRHLLLHNENTFSATKLYT